MSTEKNNAKIVIAAVVIMATMAWLAFTGVRDNKSYYVTISELQAMGNKAYVRHLRVAGNVAPGSIHRTGTYVDFAQRWIRYLRARPLDEKATAMRAFTREVVPHLASGRIAPLVDRVFPAEEAGAALDRLAERGKLGKVLLDFGG